MGTEKIDIICGNQELANWLKLLVQSIKNTKVQTVVKPYDYDEPWTSEELVFLRREGIVDPLQFLKDWESNGCPIHEETIAVVSCLYDMISRILRRTKRLQKLRRWQSEIDKISGREDVLI